MKVRRLKITIFIVKKQFVPPPKKISAPIKFKLIRNLQLLKNEVATYVLSNNYILQQNILLFALLLFFKSKGNTLCFVHAS